MTGITATYRIVTPMFLGDADQKATSLRPPSIKGALRFWWRALNWGRCLEETGTASEALKDLHKKEACLFGSAADETNSGQGLFLLNVQYSGRPLEPGQLPQAQLGHQYLLGQGLYNFKEKYLRSALEPSECRLRLLFRPRTTNKDRESIAQALLVMGLLGGLGSRSRKGFGSLAIQTLEGSVLQVPSNLDDLQQTLANLMAIRLDGLPPYTAFSRQSRIDAIPAKPNQNIWTLLGELGAEMQLYRSWGQNGRVGGEKAEKNFPDDHNLAREAAQENPVTDHPQRAVFGLPHNYYFSSLADPHKKLKINAISPKPDANSGWSDIDAQRRASPLFIHLHEFSNGSQTALLMLLPARFLPTGWKVGMSLKKQLICQTEPNPDWAVLHRFMDRFSNRRTLLEAHP